MTKEEEETGGTIADRDLCPYPQPHHKSDINVMPWLDTREKTPTHMDF